MNLRRSAFGMFNLLSIALLLAASSIVVTAAMDNSATPSQKVDSILILKKDHLLELLAGGRVIRTYKVALGRGGLAPKEREGDGRTPEGTLHH